MKRITITLTFLLLVIMSVQAQTVQFSYDAAGNRIKREVIRLKQSFESENDSLNCIQPVTTQLQDARVVIYPNPTKGMLILEISDPGIQNEVIIITSQGNIILHRKALKSATTLDLSAYPAGLYILQLNIDNMTSEWKIIKE